MKILLDECVPWPMHALFSGHICSTAQREGWGGIRNVDPLNHAEARFNPFITSDQNLRFQHNLSGRRIAIIELSTNKLRRTTAAASALRETVSSIQPSEFRHIEIP